MLRLGDGGMKVYIITISLEIAKSKEGDDESKDVLLWPTLEEGSSLAMRLQISPSLCLTKISIPYWLER